MKRNIGVIITLVAAVFWGFSGTCAQYIFDNFDADPTYLTAVRLLAAGLILVIIGLFTDRKNMISIWTDRTSALRLIIFSVTGFLFCQLTYMKAISYSNSGTATILQYLGPVLIMIVSCFLARKLPKRKRSLCHHHGLDRRLFHRDPRPYRHHGDHASGSVLGTLVGGSLDALHHAAGKNYRQIRKYHCDGLRHADGRHHPLHRLRHLECAHGLRYQMYHRLYRYRALRHHSAFYNVFGRRQPLWCSKGKHAGQHRAGGCHCLHGRLAESASANYGYSRFYVYLCDYFPADQERITSIRRRQPADVAGCFFCIKFDK